MCPSLFIIVPHESVLKDRRCESVAYNIMLIMMRTGDRFKRLSWPEYVIERKKDQNFGDHEREYFDKVIEFCINAQNAALFSPTWHEIYILARALGVREARME